MSVIMTSHRDSTNRARRGSIGLLLLLCGTAVGIVGCGGAEERSISNTFFFNINTEPNSLDPIQISQQASWWIGGQIYEGLVALDTAMNPIGAVADRWETSEDGLTWTFHIRPDVRFADSPVFPEGKGRAVTAEDIRYSFERVCTPGSAGYWVFRGKVIGVEEYYDARAEGSKSPAVEHVTGFEIIDDKTFVIRLREPFAPFIYLLTTPFCYIVPEEGVQAHGEDFQRNPVGTGPFRLVQWNEGQQIVMTRNANYYRIDESGTTLPYLDSIWVTFIGDPATEFTEFTAGNLDMITAIDPTFAERILTEDGSGLQDEYAGYGLHTHPGMSIEYYGFTLDPTTPAGAVSPFASNVHLRKALNYAVDRERISRFVLNGLATPAHHGPIPPSTPCFSGVEGYRYDPEKVRAHLDSAGFPNGEGLGPFEIQVSSSKQTTTVAEAIQEDLKKAGFKVSIKPTEQSAHLAMADQGEVAIWRTSWLADYPHAENFMANFYSPYRKPNGPNRSRYDNPTVDSLYLAALAPGLTRDEQKGIYARMERIVLDDAPWIFLYYSRVHHLTQPWITGYRSTPLQTFDLIRVRKGEAGELPS